MNKRHFAKALTLCAVAVMCVTTAYGQNVVGALSLKPMVGFDVSSLIGGGAEDTKMTMGLVAGAELSYQVTPRLALSGGAMYAKQGCKIDMNRDREYRFHYINIPLLANYYVASGLAVKAGLQPGILIRALENGYWEYAYDKYVNVGELFHKIDISIPVGISYEYKHFVVDARYCFALTKVATGFMGSFYNNPPIYMPQTTFIQTLGFLDTNVRNSVFMLTVGYNIPL